MCLDISPFTNPVIVGKFVYHCHIVAHEDNGMMAVIEVLNPRTSGKALEPADEIGTRVARAGSGEALPAGRGNGASPHHH
jgi:hypothetical protein